MILQVAPLSSEKPHISANELGKYVFSSPAGRVAILRAQKFKNPGPPSYYSPSERAIRKALQGNSFDKSVLMAEREKIHPKNPAKPYHQHKTKNNREILLRFYGFCQEAAPAEGAHSKPRSAQLELEDVTISIRPEILTESHATGFFSLTKFYFSKHKVSADAADIVMLLLIKYGQAYPRPGLCFDLEATKLIDFYAAKIIHGHTIPRHREQQLLDALKDIQRRWPMIQPKPRKGFFYEGPGG